MQDAGIDRVTLAMVTDALKLSGIELADDDRQALVDSANTNLERLDELRAFHIPNDVSPPYHFSPVVAGMKVDKTRLPWVLSKAPALKRPARLEDVAFWPLRHLAELVRTRQVSSVELTRMYLERLHRYNGRLNNVVTFLDDHGLAEAASADRDIAAGRYKGPLHGLPWGCKDIITVKGFKTTWGSPAFTEQQFDYDASVVEMLRDAGAVLIAKLATGELAAGDNWFGGQTKSPWDPTQGSSGSSAGPASATAAGCVAFAIGTETSGSILSPAARCGVVGLRPTFGRISRYGAMALSWTQDRLGPFCRHAEDCAVVMQAVAKPDGRDMSVTDVPFNWNAGLDVRTLKVGILQASFDELTEPAAKANAAATLDALRALGVKDFAPVPVPDFALDVSAIGVEAAAFTDEHARAGRMAKARDRGRPTGRLMLGRRLPARTACPHDDDGGARHGHRATWTSMSWPRTASAAAVRVARRRHAHQARRVRRGRRSRQGNGTSRWPTSPAIRPSTCPTASPVTAARRPASCSTPSRTANISSWRWPRPTRTRRSGTCERRPHSTPSRPPWL